MGELPLTVGESFRASDPFGRSCLCHLGGMLLLKIRGGLVQSRSLVVRGGRTQMNRERVAALRRLRPFALFH
jgi:hypothetical protein